MLQAIQKHLKEICPSIKNFLEKVISRKFIVWLVATHMTYIQILESESWMFLSMMYVGANTLLNWKHGTVTQKEQTVPENQIPARPMQ